MTNPPIEKAARASEKNKRKNYKQFRFLGLLLGLPLQQQQQQHWKTQVRILKSVTFEKNIILRQNQKESPGDNQGSYGHQIALDLTAVFEEGFEGGQSACSADLPFDLVVGFFLLARYAVGIDVAVFVLRYANVPRYG
jgi:hypothetical protein